MAIRRPPTTFSDTISTTDIADDAITGGKLANDIGISTTGNIATTGSGTLSVAGTSTLTGNATASGNLTVSGTSTLSGNSTVGGTLATSGAFTASGGIANAGTISAGTIGTSVAFPTRSDFGIIETISAGNPLLGTSTSQDFSYTSGQEYCVMLEAWFTDGNYSSTEVYRINTNNTVTEISSPTGNVTPSIPSSGTLRITTSTSRWVRYVELIRMDW